MAAMVPGVKVVAAADCYDGCLDHAKELWGNDILTTRDYNEILARKDIDAVIIGTPDHWHMQASIDAMNAGKDVYCEKPMIHLYSDGPKIIDTWRKTNRIMQIGQPAREFDHLQEGERTARRRRHRHAQHGDGVVRPQFGAWARGNIPFPTMPTPPPAIGRAGSARRPRFPLTASASSSGAGTRITEAAWRAICLSTCSAACT